MELTLPLYQTEHWNKQGKDINKLTSHSYTQQIQNIINRITAMNTLQGSLNSSCLQLHLTLQAGIYMGHLKITAITAVGQCSIHLFCEGLNCAACASLFLQVYDQCNVLYSTPLPFTGVTFLKTLRMVKPQCTNLRPYGNFYLIIPTFPTLFVFVSHTLVILLGSTFHLRQRFVYVFC
jgi:hypothetical protein